MGQVNARYCPVCGAVRDFDLVYFAAGFPIRRCHQCGLGAADVGIEASQSESLYSKGYFSGQCREGYADYLGSEAVLRREFRSLLRLVRKYRTAGRLLEIGCAYGFLIAEAQQYFDVLGVDVSTDALDHCRRNGLHVEPGPLMPDFPGRHAPFDIAILADVIEHLANPAEVLETVARSLNPGGHLVITTGDWESLLSKIMRSKWRLMTPPQHLFFYSARTLTTMLARVGFTVLNISRPSKCVPLDLILFQLQRIAGKAAPRHFEALSEVGLPVNLFDALRVIAVRY